MPHFVDIHKITGGVTADAVAVAHTADVAVQAKHAVNYVKYWVNESQGKIFCLCSAPSAQAADQAHREAHGLVAARIIEVDPDMVDGFLGGGPVAPTGAVLLPRTKELDPGLRIIVFTDIVGSTATTQRLGDKAAMAILDIHDSIVRNRLSLTEGREIKHLGDGIMAVFTSAEQAVRFASLVHADLAGHAVQHPGEPVRIRIGSACGEPVEKHGDFFGSTVQLASRLCAHADPGQTLVTTAITELCAGKGLCFQDVGEVLLKGFEEPVRAHAVSTG